jgi:phosphatidylserine/phosphatidylglycerophosphate/cardiolipin synthase-like enzyme
MKLRYYLFVFLFIFCACSSAAIDEPQPSSDGGDDSGGSSTSLTPAAITFPEADFTSVRAIKQGQASKAIIGRLAGLIDATPKGASIYISIFIFKNEYGLLNAIRQANNRGVKLHIIIDMSSANHRKGNASTIENLKAMGNGIDVVETYNDAQANAINHNKLVLFSELSTKKGKAKNVVFTSSENWAPSTEKNMQNAVILSDKGLYQAYLHYWKEMKERAAGGMKNYTFIKYSDPDGGIWAYLFPKRKKGNRYGPDPMIKILDEISDPSEATIQIEMPIWTKYRIRVDHALDGVSIVDKLSQLLKQGAKVEIVARSNIDAHDEVAALAGQGAFVKMYNYTDEPGVKKIKLHSKVMLIQGEWNGKKTRLVIAGSQNFGGKSITANNNNTIVLSSYHFKHPQFFKKFEDNFNKMKTLPGICCSEKD